jgi:prolyl-tRNA synthetase
MKQTDLFLKTKKEALKDDTSLNSQLLYRAGYIDKTMAGAYALLPLGFKLHENICNLIRKELSQLNTQEVKLNVLTPKEN